MNNFVLKPNDKVYYPAVSNEIVVKVNTLLFPYFP